MKRLGWTQGERREYFIKTYGVTSRLYLSDEELIEFWQYLKPQQQQNEPETENFSTHWEIIQKRN